MVIATMLFMCVEMLLATSKAMLPQKPAVKSMPKREAAEVAQTRIATHV